MASHFSTDGRFMNSDNPGNLSLIKSCFHQCSSFQDRLEKHTPTAAYFSCQLRRVALEVWNSRSLEGACFYENHDHSHDHSVALIIGREGDLLWLN